MKDSVPVSGRVSPAIADMLVQRADNLGLTLSKTVGFILSKSISGKKDEKEKCELINEKWREIVGELINEFSKDNKTQNKMLDFVSKKVNEL